LTQKARITKKYPVSKMANALPALAAAEDMPVPVYAFAV
jgi:hypothetical protein